MSLKDIQRHCPRRLSSPYPDGWVLYLTTETPSRLVVFVHGFRGGGVTTWQDFPDGGRVTDWWRSCDLLFVSYDSMRDSVTGVAARLRRVLPRFYPESPNDVAAIGQSTGDAGRTYRELYLVGHSLGGVIARRCLCDVAQEWIEQGGSARARPPLLDARLRLFSPASAGMRLAGWTGCVEATSVRLAVNMYLRRASTFTDLQPASPLLETTRRRTERLAEADPERLGALRASIVWANPDNVVLQERYETDWVDHAQDDTTHGSVCKPSSGYVMPWHFVETGAPS